MRRVEDAVLGWRAPCYCCCCAALQASLIAEEVLREKGDAVRVLFNKFHSAISFKPTLATVLSAEGLDRQLATDQGSKLDTYELEVAAERGDVLQDLAEFQLAAVSGGCPSGGCVCVGGCGCMWASDKMFLKKGGGGRGCYVWVGRRQEVSRSPSAGRCALVSTLFHTPISCFPQLHFVVCC